MDISVGSILDGKVRTITKFGAFISLPEGRSGLVHISEISNTFVKEVSDVLTPGQEVQVLVLSIEEGKINLSIKRAQPHAPSEKSFEDKLKAFMSESQGKLAGCRQYEHITKNRKR